MFGMNKSKRLPRLVPYIEGSQECERCIDRCPQMGGKTIRASWECYKIGTHYGIAIRRTGDFIFEALVSKAGKEDNSIRFSENATLFTGLPYDWKAFRGLTAYIARKAAKCGACFVVSPIIDCGGNTMEITIVDFEMALINMKKG